MSTTLYENSMYRDAAGKAAIVDDKPLVVDLFFLNFLGFIGLYALNDSRGYMKDFEKTEKKLMINDIGDENHDVSLIIKLAVGAGLLTTTKTVPLTKFLALIKQRRIRSADIDSMKVREMIEQTQLVNKPMNSLLKSIVKGFMAGTFDVKEYARQAYDIAKKNEFRDYTLEFRTLIIKGQYTDYFTAMKRSVAANGHSAVTSQGVATKASTAAAPPSQASAPVAPANPGAGAATPVRAAVKAPALTGNSMSSPTAFMMYMQGLDAKAVEAALKKYNAVNSFIASTPANPSPEYKTWGEHLLFNRIIDINTAKGEWTVFDPSGISASAAKDIIGRVAVAAKNASLSPVNRHAAVKIYNELTNLVPAWPKIEEDIVSAKEYADMARQIKLLGISRTIDPAPYVKKGVKIDDFYAKLTAAVIADPNPWSVSTNHRTATPWYIDCIADFVRDGLKALTSNSQSASRFTALPVPFAGQLTATQGIPDSAIKWRKKPAQVSAAVDAVGNAIIDWLETYQPTTIDGFANYIAAVSMAKTYASWGSPSLAARMRVLYEQADPTAKDHKAWFLTMKPNETVLRRTQVSPECWEWASSIANKTTWAAANMPGTTVLATKVVVIMSSKPTVAEIRTMPTAAVLSFMAANFNKETIVEMSSRSFAEALITKVEAWYVTSNNPQFSFPEPSKDMHQALLDSEGATGVVNITPWNVLLAKMVARTCLDQPKRTAELWPLAPYSKRGIVTVILTNDFTLFLNSGGGSWAVELDKMVIGNMADAQSFVAQVAPVAIVKSGDSREFDITGDNVRRAKWLLAAKVLYVSGVSYEADAMIIGSRDAIPSDKIATFFKTYGVAGKWKVLVAEVSHTADEYALAILAKAFKIDKSATATNDIHSEVQSASIERWRTWTNEAIAKYGIENLDGANSGFSRYTYYSVEVGSGQALANDLTPAQVQLLAKKVTSGNLIGPSGNTVSARYFEAPLSAGAVELLKYGLVSFNSLDEKWKDDALLEALAWACANINNNSFAAEIVKRALRYFSDENVSIYLDTITKVRAAGWNGWRPFIVAMSAPTDQPPEYVEMVKEAWQLDKAPPAALQYLKDVVQSTGANYILTTNAVSELTGLSVTELEMPNNGNPYIRTPLCFIVEYGKDAIALNAKATGTRTGTGLGMMRNLQGQNGDTNISSQEYFDVFAKSIADKHSSDPLYAPDFTSLADIDTCASFVKTSKLPADTVKAVTSAIQKTILKRMEDGRIDDLTYLVDRAKASYDVFINKGEIQAYVIRRLAVSESKKAADTLSSMAYRSRTDPKSMVPSASFIAAVRLAGKERAVINRLLKIDGTEAALSQMKSDPLGTPIDLDAQRAVSFFRYNDIDITSLKVTANVKRFEDMNNIGATIIAAVPPLPMTEITAPAVNIERIRQLHRSNRYNHNPALGLEVKRTFEVDIPGQKDRFEAWVKANPTTKIATLYHGTGTIAAQFLLRYGFRIIKSTDSSVTGRMLGDGIYFADNVNKTMLYMSNAGYIRQPNQEGYIFKCRVALGKSPKNHREGNAEKRGLVSNEWAVFDVDQILMEEAYYGVSRTKKSIATMLSESNNDAGLNESTFIFMDGLVPVSPGKYVPFEEFMKTMPAHCYIETTAVGPMVCIRHDTTIAEKQGCYRYASDIRMEGDEQFFLSLLNNTY